MHIVSPGFSLERYLYSTMFTFIFTVVVLTTCKCNALTFCDFGAKDLFILTYNCANDEKFVGAGVQRGYYVASSARVSVLLLMN